MAYSTAGVNWRVRFCEQFFLVGFSALSSHPCFVSFGWATGMAFGLQKPAVDSFKVSLLGPSKEAQFLSKTESSSSSRSISSSGSSSTCS